MQTMRHRNPHRSTNIDICGIPAITPQQIVAHKRQRAHICLRGGIQRISKELFCPYEKGLPWIMLSFLG